MNGTLTVNAGQELTGNGDFSGVSTTVVADGGVLAPGNSTGTITGGDVTWADGGIFEFEVNDFLGSAGDTIAGWDLLNADSLDISATGGAPFEISLVSLDASQIAGLAANFDDTESYSLLFASTTGGITGFNSNKFVIDASGFQNPYAGTWLLRQDGNNLYLDFAAVPEPAGFALFTLLSAGVVRVRRRRKTADYAS